MHGLGQLVLKFWTEIKKLYVDVLVKWKKGY